MIREGWETVICVASGPSLTEADCERVKQSGCRVIAINNSYQRVPFADVLFARDLHWWKGYTARAGKQWPRFEQECWTTDAAAAERFCLNYVRGYFAPGLSGSQDRIHMGPNSGFAAIGLAVYFGAKRILLLGYDAKRTDGKDHWHGTHEPGMWTRLKFERWIPAFGRLAKSARRSGIEIVNCSAETALTCFPRVTLEQALR